MPDFTLGNPAFITREKECNEHVGFAVSVGLGAEMYRSAGLELVGVMAYR